MVRIIVSELKTKYVSALCAVVFFCTFSLPFRSQAQLVISANKTAAILSGALAGAGVSVFAPTLSCAGNANAIFSTGAVSPLGLASGIILTTGNAKDSTIGSILYYGVGDPSSTFCSRANGTAGDAQLTTLSGNLTYDACILQFDFKPAGDTVRFRYVFGSEEYTGYTCSPFNDAFAFFITGGAYVTPTNLAVVPGTSIPVAVNSVNCGATGGWAPATCAAMGPGAPFCAYFVNNLLPASPAFNYVSYDGLTTVMPVVARVNPCDTYHLKLAIADGSDDSYDSGVFIEGGSLTSTTTSSVVATGTSGLPYCIRGCAPGNFVFSLLTPQDTAVTIRYLISGTAVNGYDYSTIPTSIVIPPFTLSGIVNINTLLVPPVGPKVVTLTIQIPDPCHPGVYTNGAVASLTILDSFSYHIVTPDTAICLGQSVTLVAVGDTMFTSILHYRWTPGGIADTFLTTTSTPSVTTVYTLTATTAAVLGCAPEHRTVKVTVNNPTGSIFGHTNPTVCGYCDGTITLAGLQTGSADTVVYDYNSVPQPPLPVTVSPSGTVVMTGLCPGLYSGFYVKVGVCRTPPLGSVTIVEAPPPTVAVDSHVVKTCVGVAVQLHAYPTPSWVTTYSYTWTPPTDLSNPAISNPIVTPSVAGDVTYTVTINPGTNPACAARDTVHVHTVPNDFILQNPDTAICIGQSVQVRVTGNNEFTWSWSPPTGVSNTTIPNPVITPAVTTTYSVTASYAHCPNMVHSFNIEVDYPAPVRTFTDTTCLGTSDSFDVTVPGSAYYHYQWTPPTYVSNDTIPNPYLTPTVTGTFTWTITIQPHAAACAITDMFTLLVTPNTVDIMPHDTAICKGKIFQVRGTPFPLYTYQWLPTAGIAISNVINPTITADTSALYVVAAHFYKCPDMYDTLRLDVQPNPTMHINGSRAVCEFDTLHLHAVVSPGWYQYYIHTWTPATYLDHDTGSTVVFTGGSTGYVHDSVTTTAGCKSIDSIRITVYPGNFDSINAKRDYCPHDTAILQPLGAGASYLWQPSLYISDSTAKNPVISPITSESYTVIATSINGCKDTLYFNTIVHPGAVINIDDSTTLYAGETIQIHTQTNCVNFQWTPTIGLNNPYVSDPVASPEVSTRYIVHGTTQYGCDATDSIYVYYNPESLLALPNAFTPGTGPNNEFKIIKRGFATLKYFRIFNRWGNLVFETTDIDKGWNGEYKGTPQPFGVYVYQVEALTSNRKIFVKTGNVTLIR